MGGCSRAACRPPGPWSNGWRAWPAWKPARSCGAPLRARPERAGVIALPWFGGARAPWWRDTARGAVLGLSFDHDVGDMARAVVESVAWDVERCLESVTGARPDASRPQGLVLGGGGADNALWTEILTAVTGLPARRRRSGEAASAGAAMVVAEATGAGLGQEELGHEEGAHDEPVPDRLRLYLERVDPVDADMAPDATMLACYRRLRPTVDAAAEAVVALGG